MPNLTVKMTVQLNKRGVVSQISYSLRGKENGTSELIISTYKGITFAVIKEDYTFTEN